MTLAPQMDLLLTRLRKLTEASLLQSKGNLLVGPERGGWFVAVQKVRPSGMVTICSAKHADPEECCRVLLDMLPQAWHATETV